jgi:hypothetical protein
MSHRGANYKHMKDLMRTSPKIEPPWSQPFGDSGCIYPRTQDVQKSLEQKPAEANLPHHLVTPVQLQPVDDGKHC